MEKYIKDGKVAVIYSPGFGAGWYTWNHGDYGYELVFDPGLVDLIINERPWDQVEAYATLKWPGVYVGGLQEAVVEWIAPGVEFKITEYDGSESLQFRNSDDWLVA
jgi:hypothetical protein